MPRRPNIIQRIVHRVRNRISPPDEEEGQGLSEEHRRHLVEELELRQRERIIAYNEWIGRQQDIAHNLLLQTINQRELSNPGRPLVYTFSLLQVPEGVRSITRSLILVIEDNGMRFQMDLIQLYDGGIVWAVTAQ